MSKRKVLFEEEGSSSTQESSKPKTVNGTVPKAQYDQLLGKYEALLDKIKSAEATSSSKMANTPASPKSDSDMITQLSKIQPPADLAETVDVFGKNGLANKIPAPAAMETTTSRSKLSDSALERQINTLHKADKLVRQNRMDSALILLRDLEESPNPQIKVRAKYYLAEMLFRQNEYDLAMQMYEEIIKKYAFSGLVIKSLGRLIVCSEKLKLGKKQERYYSILHDFFERS
ncbi:tol-pal system YbgF family protein [Bacteriovorax sp. DB6_IX]|uniref:tetratricopeptide repeat protein n=1 Tax=Bacteriovorax sp. DB6_IX TaxID=1353530 RepID=UPI00041C4BB7|nr:tetratricopeptide repeat protein [Bacteriovorax sp. DB6_IX]